MVSRYLEGSGLLPYFEALGFHITAYGCTTCIGNSGPLNPEIERVIKDHDLNVAAVLSGNRNFEARIHQLIKSNFLASPMLVLAFALAGRVDIDLTTSPLAYDPNGQPVYLKEIWPGQEKVDNLVRQFVTTEAFKLEYAKVFDGDNFWQGLQVSESATYLWDEKSTYIKKPPYFDHFTSTPSTPQDILAARAFLLLGDSVTTDHISPAGAISKSYPAGQYLMAQGVDPEHFNSYGSRRGNHEIMMRGTFGNIRIKNRMVAPKEGAFTIKYPERMEMYNYDAAMAYHQEGTPLIVLAGKEYGTGSSRDWAAKGTNLLGVRAVIAESFERIHRNNLVGMGALPLVFKDGQNAGILGLDGSETYSILGLANISPRKELSVEVVRTDGTALNLHGHCPPRHGGRCSLFPAWRHPPLCPAANDEGEGLRTMDTGQLADLLQTFAKIRLRPDKSSYTSLLLADAWAIGKQTGLSLRQVENAALTAGILPERYSRNQKSLSCADQLRLLQSHVAIIGLGGLGGTVTEILARLGVGGLTLVDGDVFDESNLNRQLLSSPTRLGEKKASAAATRVRNINPAVEIRAIGDFFTADNSAGHPDRCTPGGRLSGHHPGQVSVGRGLPQSRDSHGLGRHRRSKRPGNRRLPSRPRSATDLRLPGQGPAERHRGLPRHPAFCRRLHGRRRMCRGHHHPSRQAPGTEEQALPRRGQ